MTNNIPATTLNSQQSSVFRRLICLCPLALVVPASLLTTSISSATVSLNETYLYYDVTGDSAPQIRKAINAKRLLGAGSNQYDAQTLWSLILSYEYQDNKSTCSVSSASVVVNISYRLPRWQASHDADFKVRQAWDKYFTLLKAHELEHGKIALQAGPQLYRKILAIKTPSATDSLSNCSSLAASIDKLVSDQDRRINEQQAEFDKRTNHGASFP